MRLKTTCSCETVSWHSHFNISCYAFDVSLKLPQVGLERENSVAKKGRKGISYIEAKLDI